MTGLDNVTDQYPISKNEGEDP